MDIRFEWDLDKEAANRRKHDITFGSAVQAFDDPFALTELERIVEGEERWQTLGMIDGQVILLVAHTIRENEDEQAEVIRIISARRAERKERRRYEAAYVSARS